MPPCCCLHSTGWIPAARPNPPWSLGRCSTLNSTLRSAWEPQHLTAEQRTPTAQNQPSGHAYPKPGSKPKACGESPAVQPRRC
ncbi:hypothetical protein B0H10DRAFT_2023276 [Mycena sp. CBHHK59/15]|nr:hypothetical protein B0H10DRAFT_2023276 [Mycena sp. CBHHK59/15]